jgi:hypothetical protein
MTSSCGLQAGKLYASWFMRTPFPQHGDARNGSHREGYPNALAATTFPELGSIVPPTKQAETRDLAIS